MPVQQRNDELVDLLRPEFVSWDSYIGGGKQYKVEEKTANYTITLADHHIDVDASSGAVTITLPALSSAYDSTNNLGYVFRVSKNDSSSNAVTLDGNGAETINGETTQVIIFQYDTITVHAVSATEWRII